MIQTLSLKCPNCGANLQISETMNEFACGYCGVSQIVERQGGTVSLRLLTDAISRVQTGTDKTAAELAIRRLKEELSEIENSIIIVQRNKETKVNANNNLCGVGWIASLLISLVFACQGGGLLYLGIFLGIAFTILVLVYFFKNNIEIQDNYVESHDKLINKARDIKKKISQNKKIVDT